MLFRWLFRRVTLATQVANPHPRLTR